MAAIDEPLPREHVSGWRDHAACRDVDPEVFFPVPSSTDMDVDLTLARRVCARCEVRPQCLAHALATEVDYGVWGGLTPEERKSPLHDASGDSRRRSA